MFSDVPVAVAVVVFLERKNLFIFISFYHKIQITIKEGSYTKENESDEETQKETTRPIDIGLPQSKNKVNINSFDAQNM